MGALDDIAAALRARTGKRVYGTPFYEQKLQELDQASQGRDIGNQQAALNLQQDQELFPIQVESAKALTAGREATTGFTEQKTAGLEYQNSPEYRALQEARQKIQMDAATHKDAMSQITAASQLRKIDAEIEKLHAQTANVGKAPVGRPGQGLQVVPDATGNLVIVDKTTGQSKPVSSPGGEQMKARVPAAEMEKRAGIQNQLSSLDELERLSGGEAGKNIGVLSGRISDAQRKYIGTDADTTDMFRIADNLGTQLAQARSGSQVSEKEYIRLKGLVPDPRTPRSTFDANLKAYRRELENIMAARQGQPLPTQGGNSVKWGRDAQGNPVRIQ